MVVIVGDLNYPNINWCDRQYTSPTSGNFIDLWRYFLNQCVEEGTRGRNTLGLIFSNEEIIKNVSGGGGG